MAKFMEKHWTYHYGQNKIMVKDTLFDGRQLYVNGQMVDSNNSLLSNLQGKLESGEEIKAAIGGAFKIQCSLFIDNELQTPRVILGVGTAK